MCCAAGCFTRTAATAICAVSHRLVVGLGVDDLVVVETDDVVLVAHRDRAQDIKAIVGRLERDGAPESKAHRRIYRPWGHYDGVVEGDRWQVKKIEVKPGASLSCRCIITGRSTGWW
jgi:mannose-1-phosphate guanylyltransferase/mannose-6-phosphate isomerase